MRRRRSCPSRNDSVARRLRYEAGDMFEEVPAADAYVLKLILHDWDDAIVRRRFSRTCARGWSAAAASSASTT